MTTSSAPRPATYSDEWVATRHPRQQRAWAEVPLEHRAQVGSRLNLLMNTTPGLIYSQAIDLSWADLQRLGLDHEAHEALSRADNKAALRACNCGSCH